MWELRVMSSTEATKTVRRYEKVTRMATDDELRAALASLKIPADTYTACEYDDYGKHYEWDLLAACSAVTPDVSGNLPKCPLCGHYTERLYSTSDISHNIVTAKPHDVVHACVACWSECRKEDVA